MRSRVTALVAMTCVALGSCSAPSEVTSTTVGASTETLGTSPSTTAPLERSVPETEIVESLAKDLANNLAVLGVDPEGADCAVSDLVAYVGPERAAELDTYEDEATNDDWVLVIDGGEREASRFARSLCESVRDVQSPLSMGRRRDHFVAGDVRP